MIILGVDGLDPDLLTKFMAEGKMPNFARLAQEGSFERLTTSIPPQSPVAWSNLITGMNAGGHGIFDFIHRDPKTFQLYFSTSRVEAPKHNLHFGNWVVPLGSGTAEQLRHGKAFWEILDDHHVPNYIYRMPANFPPIGAKGKTLSGMGTPDLRGSYGTFSFYTDDPAAAIGATEGGEVLQVEVKDNRVTTNLIGPDNSFRKNSPPATEPFTVDVDPLESVARINVQNQQFVLKEGEWSGWIPVEFQLMPLIGNVKGICRFYLKQTHPVFSFMFRQSILIRKILLCQFLRLKLFKRSGEADWRIPYAGHCRRYEGAHGWRARRQRISGAGAYRARPSIGGHSTWSFPNFAKACFSFIFPALI
jgi:Uncharacterized conserved protein